MKLGGGAETPDFLVDGAEFGVLGADDEVEGEFGVGEFGPEGGLDSGAHVAERSGEFGGIVLVAALEKVGEAGVGFERSEEFGSVPAIEEGGKIGFELLG